MSLPLTEKERVEKERKLALLSHLKKEIESDIKAVREELLKLHESTLDSLETTSFSTDIGDGSKITYTKKYTGYDDDKIAQILIEKGLDKEVAFDKKVTYVVSASKLENLVDVGHITKETLESLRTYSISITPKLSDNDKIEIEKGLK